MPRLLPRSTRLHYVPKVLNTGRNTSTNKYNLEHRGSKDDFELDNSNPPTPPTRNTPQTNSNRSRRPGPAPPPPPSQGNTTPGGSKRPMKPPNQPPPPPPTAVSNPLQPLHRLMPAPTPKVFLHNIKIFWIHINCFFLTGL